MCLRFDIDYTLVLLGARKLFVSTRGACQREREQPEDVEACATAEDLAKAYDTKWHSWLHLLPAQANEKTASVD